LNHQPGQFVSLFCIVLAILAISTASIFVRFAQNEAPSIVIAALRLALATLALAPLALGRCRSELRRLTRHELLLALMAGVFLAIHFAAWVTSLEYTSVASSVVLVSTGPLWVALLSPLILKEQLRKAVLTGMLIALVGGVIITLGDNYRANTGFANLTLSGLTGSRTFFGNMLALAGAWTLAGYLLIGRRLRVGISLVPYVFLVYGIAAVVLLAVMFAAGQRPTGYSSTTYFWILALALVPQLIGHSLFNWALRFFPAALVSITVLGEPLGSVLLAYLILHEAPTQLTALGGMLVLAGLVISTRRQA